MITVENQDASRRVDDSPATAITRLHTSDSLAYRIRYYVALGSCYQYGTRLFCASAAELSTGSCSQHAYGRTRMFRRLCLTVRNSWECGCRWPRR